MNPEDIKKVRDVRIYMDKMIGKDFSSETIYDWANQMLIEHDENEAIFERAKELLKNLPPTRV